MSELKNIKPEINVLDSEYKRLLGYPPTHELEGRSLELMDWAKQWYNENGKPWVYTFKTDEIKILEDGLVINNTLFSSKKVRDKFFEAEAESAFIAAVSAGKELEEKASRLWTEGKPDEYFFLEIYGSAVVENLTTTTGARFCDWADKHKLVVIPHYSPGYPGWDIEDQNLLWELIKKHACGKLPGEISAFETGMLKPKKSQLSVFGITKQTEKVQSLKGLIPCETCSLPGCRYRRKPYKKSIAQIENVSTLNGKNKNDFDQTNNEKIKNGYTESVLEQDAKYSVSTKALKKWAEQKLKLKICEDSSVEAKFLYEGTTCSNLGRSLSFEYQIKLSPESGGYKIVSLKCKPAEGDDGYTYMCDYITEHNSLLEKIEDEKPLLGKSINSVLTWKRSFNPEGCLCKHESREHKWGLVLEVIHYALVNMTNKKLNDKNEKLILEF